MTITNSREKNTYFFLCCQLNINAESNSSNSTADKYDT